MTLAYSLCNPKDAVLDFYSRSFSSCPDTQLSTIANNFGADTLCRQKRDGKVATQEEMISILHCAKNSRLLMIKKSAVTLGMPRSFWNCATF